MKKINITILFIAFVVMAFSQEKVMINKEKFLSEISKISKSTTSIEADFKQEKTVSYLKDKIISSGKFYTENGNMRWQQTKPYQYIMLLSENGVKIKDEGKEKEYGAMAGKFMEQIRNILLSSVDGSFNENTDFKTSYFEDDNFYIVKLLPTNRRLSKMFKGINLAFDKKTYRLKILTFVQDDGESKMFFSNEKFNTKLPTTLFTQF